MEHWAKRVKGPTFNHFGSRSSLSISQEVSKKLQSVIFSSDLQKDVNIGYSMVDSNVWCLLNR